MDILVIGGTRYFGIHMVNDLLKQGHNVTIATRGNAKDSFGDKVSRIILERTNPESMKMALADKKYDIIIDKIAYCSNDIKYVLDVADCDKYIYMSSTSVYEPKHWNTIEDDFNALDKKLVWCSRMDFPYEEIKRQAECALWQAYKNVNAIAVRYPFAIGKDDYTKRLLFYIEHTIKENPMNIDNVDCQMSYIRSDEAGKFISFLVDKEYTGPLNGSSNGTISIREILDYVELKTGKKAMISKDGEAAPYNNEPEYSINTDRAKNLGFEFTNLKDWIFELTDYYINLINSNL
ncbi:NAD-dependent epimerase/dehydratase family protein [Clostridium oryzae]|uniref:UDP-glucose 4-epimerase n=1 Tax=Clostridium oryzae TaxID=1450648 RepID=A0A1V4IMW4_9CLOT|nr:NAD-dependent epimerase/dehydratase family protein [Clostridium oryzae]OPJ61160.1 NAD dependent epimerase/dehydratase family protein [Clostridium oryzae]